MTTESQSRSRELEKLQSELSAILKTGLKPDELSICFSLIKSGANPEVVAACLKEIRREAAASQARN